MKIFYGIDVSEWQGPTGGHAPIDWQALNPGAAFAWIKGSGGDGKTAPLYVDAQLEHNKADVRSLGNSMPHGYYHFAGGKDAAEEARYFYDNVCSDLQVGEAVALDWEVEHPDPNGWVNTFKSTLEALLGFHMVLYADTDRVMRFGFKDALVTSPLWIADYRYTPDQDIPSVPTYTFHQYRDNGTFPGVQGTADIDAFFASDITDFLKLGKPAPAVVVQQPQPDTVQVNVVQQPATTPTIAQNTPGTIVTPTQTTYKPSTGTAMDISKPKTSNVEKVVNGANAMNDKVIADLPEIIQTATDVLNVKSGYKTTEFWITLITDAATLSGSLLSPGSLWLKAVLAVTGVATTAVYIVGRVSLKKHALAMSATVAAASQAPQN